MLSQIFNSFSTYRLEYTIFIIILIAIIASVVVFAFDNSSTYFTCQEDNHIPNMDGIPAYYEGLIEGATYNVTWYSVFNKVYKTKCSVRNGI